MERTICCIRDISFQAVACAQTRAWPHEDVPVQGVWGELRLQACGLDVVIDTLSDKTAWETDLSESWEF